MHTVVQNDNKDYDIDVGVVFEEDNLKDLGPRATRNMVGDALNRKTKQFAEEPEIKTSCVRVIYSEGYHIDFAIYKRFKENEDDDNYMYYHASSKWLERDLRALDMWFKDEVREKGDIIRKVIRLSKTFCKSRDYWKNMPGGLLQTVVCSEEIESKFERLDEVFYYTMRNIVDRLSITLEVDAPVDNGRALVSRNIDYIRMENWKKRLKNKLNDLDILFSSECTKSKALKAWKEFFDNDYWEQLEKSATESKAEYMYDDTEQFIDDIYPVFEQYEMDIDCKVSANGFKEMSIFKYLDKLGPRFNKFIPYNFLIKCKVKNTNCPSYDKILWKVRNVGEVAKKKNCIRGQIEERGKEIIEPTSFRGKHYIECYLIKDNICVAIGHVDIPIGED